MVAQPTAVLNGSNSEDAAQPCALRAFVRVSVLLIAWNLIAAVATAQSSAAPVPTATGAARPQYELLRDEEDWSFLADRQQRTDLWDPLKYIPLGWPRDSYLSLGGEVRQQYERFLNEEWGAQPEDRNGYWLQRYMFHTDLRLGRRVRVFGQLKSGIELGRVGGPRVPDEDELDLHQGYIELTVKPRSTTAGFSVRAGRQEFNFGSARLVSVREGPNVRQSFDALRVIVRQERLRIDTFVSRPVTTTAGTFDDRTDKNRALWGVYLVRPTPSTRRGFDAYYLGYERLDAEFDQGAANERRHSLGTRFWGRAGAIDYNSELVAQWGTFGESKIRAWTIASDTGYRIRPSGPRVGLRADVTSGDGDRTDSTLGTFNPLFPKGDYFGLISPTGPLNQMDLHPAVDFTPQPQLRVSAKWLFFWRTQRDDGLYGVPGNLLRSGEGTRARFVGHSPGLEIEWQTTPHLSFTADLSTFPAGAFLKEAPPDRMISYFAAWTTYKF